LEHIVRREISSTAIDFEYLQLTRYAGNLAEWIETKHSLDVDVVTTLFRQLLLGVQHIHRAGIIHCDLKPENVFVTSLDACPTIKIGDFDVSRVNDDRASCMTLPLTSTAGCSSSHGFTPSYAAPEVFQHPATHSQASDIYSLGLLMFDVHPATRVVRDMCCPLPDSINTARKLNLVSFKSKSTDIDSDFVDMLAQILNTDPDSRPDVHTLLRHPFLTNHEQKLMQQHRQLQQQLADDEKKRRGRRLSCYACYGEYDEFAGIICPQGCDDHFVCAECFVGHLNASRSSCDLRHREGHVYCPSYNDEKSACHGYDESKRFFTDIEIARCCQVCSNTYRVDGASAFDAYIKQQIRLKNAAFAAEVKEDYRVQLREECDRLIKLDKHSHSVHLHRTHIVDNILTLRCPRCQQAFCDFRGCFALRCCIDTCQADFCGWCLEEQKSSQMCHRHTETCPQKIAQGTTYYGEKYQFEEAMHRLRSKKLQKYMVSVNSKLHDHVLDAIFADATSHGLQELVSRLYKH
jgi:Protein kinase domain